MMKFNKRSVLAVLLVFSLVWLASCSLISESSVPYTKGTVTDGVYTNEWAGIKIVIPEDLSDDPSMYESLASSTTECGLYLKAADATRMLFIAFEKLPTFSSCTTEEYLDSVAKGMEDKVNAEDVLEDFKMPESYSTDTLGGAEYLRGDFTMTSYGFSMCQSYFVRIIDGYVVSVVTTSQSLAENDAMASLITSL